MNCERCNHRGISVDDEFICIYPYTSEDVPMDVEFYLIEDFVELGCPREKPIESPWLDEWKDFVCPVCGSTSYHDAEQQKDCIHGFCSDCLSEIVQWPDGRIEEWNPEYEQSGGGVR